MIPSVEIINKTYDKNIIYQYGRALNSKPTSGQKEQAVQDFLEDNSELIPLPFSHNHPLLNSFIISKFPLGSDHVTDYVYITKSSAQISMVLVELECPDKNYFKGKGAKLEKSSEFNDALNQVRSWKRYLSKHEEQISAMLMPLVPLNQRRNPVDFKYALVYGRSIEKNQSTKTMDLIREAENETDIKILSFDTIVNNYASEIYSSKKNIIKYSSGGLFKLKKENKPLDQALHWVGPDVLDLSNDQITKLRNKGLKIDQWLKGGSI